MLAAQRGVDGDAADALRRPSARRARGAARRVEMVERARRAWPTRRGDRRVLGQRRRRHRASLARSASARNAATLRRPIRPRAGDLAVGIALAQPHQDLSILKHLESPAAHRSPPAGTKARKGSGAPRSVRDARLPLAGSNMPISDWLHYGDHASGSIMPITHWLLYADHAWLQYAGR